MHFSQVRKIVDVLIEEYYDGFYPKDNKPSIDINLSDSSLTQLKVEIEKEFIGLKTRVTHNSGYNKMPHGISMMLNLEGFVINFRVIDKVKE